MNATLCRTTDLVLNTLEVKGQHDDYATAPMLAIRPEHQPLDEEMLYTSFEEAISDRVGVFHNLWNVAGQRRATTEQLTRSATSSYNNPPASKTPATSLSKGYTFLSSPLCQRYMQFICLALSFMMIGFDILGLLILHTR